MSLSRQHYWLLSIACGLLGGATYLPLDFLFNRLQPGKVVGFTFHLIPGFVFGRGFSACVRAVSRISLWRMGVFTVGAGAANYLAWRFGVQFGLDYSAQWPVNNVFAASFMWGLAFGGVTR